MKRALAFALALGLHLPALACEVPADIGALRAALLAGTNDQRAGAGLVLLTRDDRLEAAAQAQACRTADRQALGHRGRWFAGLGRRLQREGYAYAVAVENLAEGQTRAAEVTDAWMASPEHRANTLNPALRQAGFGVARADNGHLHWSMIGAARP